ncbi:hypothetical protein RND81_07G202400 [Saponaria officinalis]|uniref:cyclin-dependent kinase n=1 Tax=Saponaria officinalis TaxID=3572 RepID=A0AAW1JSX2_SAPOF
MAAGRNGAYNDAEFKNRNADNEMSRRDYAYSKEEFDRSSNGRRDRSHDVRGNGSRGSGNGRVRQREIKERELANGGNYRSSSSRSSYGGHGGREGGVRVGVGEDDPRGRAIAVRVVDREPGEIMSGSGSDGATESGSQGKDIKVAEVAVNVGQPPPVTKKRKFSPIVWDRDDKEVNDTYRSRDVLTVTSVPQPPACRLDEKLPTFELVKNKVVSPVIRIESEAPPSDAVMNDELVDNNDVVESRGDKPESPSREGGQGSHDEVIHLDDEDYVPTRHISASRWAGDATSPADKSEFSDDEAMQKRRRKMPSSERSGSWRKTRSSSLENEEGTREVSDGTVGRLSDSDGSILSRPSSGDCGILDEREREDHMGLEDRNNDTDSSRSLREIDSEDEDDSFRTSEPPAPPKRTLNMLQGCRSVDEFERLNKIDEGTYGVVYRARDKKTGEVVALKKVKMEKEREGFPLTSLREINILLSLHHPSIVDVKEVVVGSSLDSIFMVMEYMEHDLKGLMESMRQPYSQSEVKCLMLQLLDGIKYLHDNWVLHRDLKTSNLLLNNQGELKICDFGLARQYGSPLKPYTHLVVTLWYRAPELLLGAREYSTAIDMWSLGCIMAELLSKEPLFNGKTEFDQLDKIFKILGTPNETIWPGIKKLPGVKVNFVKHQYNQLRKKFPATSFTGSPVLSDAGFDLLNRLLTYDPEKRLTADAALKHEWFREVPLPKSKEFMPTFPAQHAQDRRMRRMLKSPDPLEEQRRKELQQPQLGTGGLFG